MQKEIPTLHEFVNNSPLVNAAITEAVHRYYYDISTEHSAELSYFWSMNPSWRKTIEDASKRYHTANTTAIQYFGQDVKQFKLSVEIQPLISRTIRISKWMLLKIFIKNFLK